MTNLRAFRLDQGLSLQALAAEVGVSYNAISMWERGTARPHPANGKRLRDFFGVPLSVLLAPANEEAADAGPPRTASAA